MSARFSDRLAAGRLLAEKLLAYAGRPDVLVLGLPRGGVPVADAVAQRLGLPLEVFVVRKLGVPWQPEFAMGAIASGNVRVLNRQVIESLGLGDDVIQEVSAREGIELARREQAYRGPRPATDLAGRVAMVIDDCVATGSTVRAAIEALRRLGAAKVVVAAPVIAHDTFIRLQGEADEVAAVLTPQYFSSVGEWYEDFTRTTDLEVHRRLLDAQGRSRPGGPPR